MAEEREDSGFVYFGRHFADPDGGLPPRPRRTAHPPRLAQPPHPARRPRHLGGRAGRRGRGPGAPRGLTDAAIWDRAAALYPRLAPWLEGKPLGTLGHSRHRGPPPAPVVDGVPAATGVVAVADAWACTNPSLGRGISIGLQHAVASGTWLRDVGTADPVEFALAFAAATDEPSSSPSSATRSTIDRLRWRRCRRRRPAGPSTTDDAGWALGKAMAVRGPQRPRVLLRPWLRRRLWRPPSALAPPSVARPASPRRHSPSVQPEPRPASCWSRSPARRPLL